MARQESTLQTILDLQKSLDQLRKEVVDNQVSNAQTRSEALKTSITALDAALDAETDFSNLD